MRPVPILIFAVLLCLRSALPALAQDVPTPPLSPDAIAAQIQPLHPKTLVLVFDVSASTKTGGIFAQERAASATLLRQGCAPGDRVVLETFGTGYQTVFDKTLAANADKDALIDQLPGDVQKGQGTNIRWPHAAALKLIAETPGRPGAVVLLTDSFNDRPLPTDPNYPKYLAYYTLKGLTIYPDTADDREYERLLRTLKATGRLHEYGVGVGIAPSGRPIERLPVGPGQGDQETDTTTQVPTVLAPSGQETPHRSYILPIGAGVLVLLLILLFLFFVPRPTPLRLKLGDKGTPRDFRLKRGAKIGLGGTLTNAAPGDDVFPLAGLSAPPAFIQGERGGALLLPAPNAPADVAVFHNGLRLEQPAPLRVGDEIRIALPATETTPPREHRVHSEDPRSAAF